MAPSTLSVIIQNYNHGRYIREALESVFSQSRQPLEVLVLDDGSTDDSLTVIGELARQHPSMRVLRNERNMGVMFSINRLMREVKGDYIHAFSADDKILPGFYERTMSLLERHPQAALCTALAMVMNERGENLELLHTPIVSPTARYLAPDEVMKACVTFGNWMQTFAIIYKRQLAWDMGMYDPELRMAIEGLWFKVMAVQHGACFVPEPLTVWRRCPNSFGVRATADLDTFLDIVDRYDRWLRGKFGHLFPSDYIDLWKRRALSGAVPSRLGMKPLETARLTRLMELIPPSQRTWSDRLFLLTLLGTDAFVWLAAKLYVWVQLPLPAQCRSIGRKLRGALPF